jgi:hypothetical protein
MLGTGLKLPLLLAGIAQINTQEGLKNETTET